MRRAEGYARIFDPAASKTLEAATHTCAHCNGIVHLHDMKTGKALAGVLVHCYQCDSNVCVRCAETGKCTPFEKQLEAMEGRARLRAAIGAG